MRGKILFPTCLKLLIGLKLREDELSTVRRYQIIALLYLRTAGTVKQFALNRCSQRTQSHIIRDWGGRRGYPNQSEYSVVKVDFHGNIASYLAELSNTTIRSLEDIVSFNHIHDELEGGSPGIHPAFGSGQDGLIASLKTKGRKDETYWQALDYTRRTTREEGIDA
jgi:hypothetical protein